MQSRDLLQLAQEFGNPLYFYDATVIKQQYNRLVGGRLFQGRKASH